MPALKLLLRRTLASPAVNQASAIFPGPKHRRQSVIALNGAAGCRSTSAREGAGLRVNVAHVKVPTATKSVGLLMGNNNRTKRLYMLCPASYSSFSSSSSSFEERENSGRVSSSSSSSGQQFLVADMGHENNKGNDGVWQQSGAVSPDKNQQPQCSKLLTLPTVLTLARVAAIPIFVGTFYVNNWWGTAATTSIFIIAAITDWLDGYLARKMGLGTAFGAFLDPVADKLMVAATLVLLCSRPPETAILGDLPWLFPVPAIAIIGREITMSAVREWAASQNTKLLQAVAVNNLGKWKTATQMTALTILLATRDSSLADPGFLVATGVVLLYISAGLAVWSLVVYVRKISKVLLK